VGLPESGLERGDLDVDRRDALRLGGRELAMRLLRGPAGAAVDLVREPAEVAQQEETDVAQVAQPAAQLAAARAGGRRSGQVGGVDARRQVARGCGLGREHGRLLGRRIRRVRLRRHDGLRHGLLRGRGQELGRLLVARGHGLIAARLSGGLGRRGGRVGGLDRRGPVLVDGRGASSCQASQQATHTSKGR
jgi:hypothetical protein